MSEKGPGKPRKKTSPKQEKPIGKQPKNVTPITQGSSAARIEDITVRQSEADVFPVNLESEIRHRAYELYEERGRQEGFDHEDWARAEAEVLSRYQRGKSA